MVSAFVLGVSAAMAVPAKPGVKKMLTLKDGSRVEATLRGDEHVHFYETADGRAFQMSEGQWQQVDRQELAQLHTERLQAANQRRAARRAPRRAGTAPAGGYTGTRRGLVILVEFADVKFTFDKATFNDYFNKVGFNLDGMRGSVHDYFLEQSYGKFDLEFDVVGPVTLTQKTTYYGYDMSTKTSQNKRVAQMVNNLCRQVDNEVDFSQYDWDNDGVVDQVYVIYAGYGAAQGADNTIWPHEWSVRGGVNSPYKTAEGVTINTYGISCELRGDGLSNKGHIDGVGTSCHEFSHCLGLPDFYDTSESGSNFGMNAWDLMDAGCYNGSTNGNSPCGYTAYERWFAGWLQPTELTSSCQVVDMPAIQDEPVAYIIYNDGNRNEYYMLENYQQKGFDTSGGGHGMLVLHVDYNTDAWSYNTVNQESSRQRMTIIPADNNYSSKSLAGDPFPGLKLKTMLTDTSSPRASLYNTNAGGSKLMNKPITDISEFKGLITFNFMGGVAVETPVVGNPTNITEKGFTANWAAVDGVKDYTVSLTQTLDGENVETFDIFEEDFEKFVASTLSSDISRRLDSYTNEPGWTGKKLYQSPHKLQVGKTANVGELLTPWFDAPVHDTLAVLVAPISVDPLTRASLQIRLFAESGGYMYADLDDIPLLTDEDAGSAWVLNAPWSYGGFQVGIYPSESGAGVYMDYLAAADGQIVVDEEEAPALAPNMVGKANVKELSGLQWKSVGLEPAKKVGMRRASRTTTAFFTTTDTYYTFTDLLPAAYVYKVRANTEDGASPWSEERTVDLITAIRSISSDEKSFADDAIYDLMGHRVNGNVLPRGLYIRNGKKFVVK